jgi:hypothetical protein
METTMQIVFPNAGSTQVTITATEFVIEGVSGKTLINALQDAFRSTDTDSTEIIVALQIVTHLLAFDGTMNDDDERMAKGVLVEMAWLADWMFDGLPGLSEETLARIKQIRDSDPNLVATDEDEDDDEGDVS